MKYSEIEEKKSYQSMTLIVVVILLAIVVLIFLVKKVESPFIRNSEKTKEINKEEFFSIESVDTKTIEETADTYHYKIQYPVFNVSTIDKEVMSYVNDSADYFASTIPSSYFESATGFIPEGEISYTLKQTGDIISIIFNGYEYTGGAHPNSFVYTLNFKNGNLLTLSNFFEGNADFLNDIKNESQQQLVNQFGEDTLFVDGLEPVSENYSHWFIEDNGIHFIFDQYQVGPYVIGMPEVVIPIPFTQ